MIIFSKKYPVLMHVLFTVSMLGIATVFCFILEELTTPESSTHVPLIYVLAVLLISRFTEGYLYGVFAAVAAVVAAAAENKNYLAASRIWEAAFP